MSVYQIEANTEVYNYQLKVIAYDQYIDNLELFLMSQIHCKSDGEKLFDEINRVKQERKVFIKDFTKKLAKEYNKIDKKPNKSKWYHNFLDTNFKSTKHHELLGKPLWMSGQFVREVEQDDADDF